MKLYELAAGTIANLLLFDDVNDECAESLNIPDFLYECCTKIDDPFTISEIFRALSNLVYVKKAEYLHASIFTLCSLIRYLAGNSLSPKLLAHVVQLVYYIQVYSPPEMLRDWEQCWDARSFYLSIQGFSIDNSGDVSVPPNEELYSTLCAMQSESIADCSGLEWLLLSIDRLTVSSDTEMSTNSQQVCSSSHTLAFVVHLLLSSSLQSWEATARKSAHKSQGVVLNPSASEKFLALSILENIVCYRTECATNGGVVTDVRALAGMYSVGCRPGFVTLLCTILEILEEALLMKDKYGVSSALYLVVQLYNHDITQAAEPYTTADGSTARPFLVAQMTSVFAYIQNVVELLGIEDNMAWILGAEAHGADIGALKAFLNMVRDNLSATCSSATETSEVPKKSLLDLLDVINSILPSLL